MRLENMGHKVLWLILNIHQQLVHLLLSIINWTLKELLHLLTFDVDKVELINQNGDGEYIGLATVYSNVAWDFDENQNLLNLLRYWGIINRLNFCLFLLELNWF